MQDDKTDRRFAQDARVERDSAAAAALHVEPASGESAAMPSAASNRAPRNARARRFGIGIVALLSVLLIGVSAFALVNEGGSSHEPPAPADAVVSADDASANEDAADGQDEPAQEGASDAADEAEAPARTDAPSAAQAASQSDEGATAQTATDAPPAASAPQAQADSQEQSAARMVNVTVSIDSSVVGNPVSGSGSFSLPQGSTVYDALCRLTTPNGGPSYVRAIGGLAEFDHGSQSGWKYSVNGVDPAKSCGSYVLSDGDVVVWRYVTSLNG
ncbi:MAG: DUF4430 domain-containing protein [Slackia sp.]|nr:DUF4430 domain-containing protein [Slackia sp.]